MRLKNISEESVRRLDGHLEEWAKKAHDALDRIAEEAGRLRDAVGTEDADQREVLLGVFPLHAAIEDVMLNLQAALAVGFALSVVGEEDEEEEK